MAAEEKEAGSYHVEVSGWDLGENFFVERTVLNWEHDGKKEVLLRAPLHEGALVFVRLISESLGGRSIPMTFLVHRIGKNGSDHGREVELERLHPKFAETTRHRAVERHEAVKV
ncbi:MAG TPA: hypothetical protein VJN21_05900 [Candidatus Acidoferrales bacterium]|nr:hypothetical protein [Candidatus Acidoferrales bacterium]